MKIKLLHFLAAITLMFSISSCGDDEPTKQDAILNNLTTSKTAYQTASNGTWVAITEAEYDLLEDNLSNTSIGGVGSSDFSASSVGIFSSQDIFVSLTGTAVNTVPEKSYVFAFKYVRYNNNDSENAQVKISSVGTNSGFTNIGNALPTATGTASSIHYYVLKGNETPTTTGSTSYIGFYTKANALGFKSIRNDMSTNYSFGDNRVYEQNVRVK